MRDAGTANKRGGPFRVAIVGSGPAGLYTADELLKHPEVERVDVFERLTTPHGLVRYGVAPDHRRTKQVTELFTKIEHEAGFGYSLGVEVGNDITLDELTSMMAGGAELEELGEELAASLGADSEIAQDLKAEAADTE